MSLSNSRFNRDGTNNYGRRTHRRDIARGRDRLSRACFEAMEGRMLFADFSVLGSTLQIDLGTGETVGVTTDGADYQFALSSGSWSGSGAGASAGGTMLTATAASFAAVKLDDTGTGNAVNFNNSGASSYASDFTVTLDNQSNGIAFNGQSYFGARSLLAQTDRNIGVNSGANVYGASITLRGADVDIAGTANVGNAGVPAVSQFIPASSLGNPRGIAMDGSGNMYIANDNGTISKATFSSPGVLGSVTTFIGSGHGLSQPGYMAFDGSGNLYVANYGGNTISKVTFSSPGMLGTVSTFVNNTHGLNQPTGIAFDSSGNLFVNSRVTGAVFKVTPAGAVSTVANVGASNSPYGLAIDGSDNLYVASFSNTTIYKVTPGGALSPFVNSGLAGPEALTFGADGNLYHGNGGTGGNILKITMAGGVSVYAPSGQFPNPSDLVFDASGNLYAANTSVGNNVVKVSAPVVATTQLTIGSSLPSGPMNLGGGAPVAGVNLSDAELDRVVVAPTGTLTLGGAGGGAITASGDVTRPAGTNIRLVSGGDVVIGGGQINTGGGTLLLDPGTSPAAVKPTRTGTDATASTVSFASDLSLGITSAAVYDALTVGGAIDLTSANLILTGSYVFQPGDVLTIVSATSISGTRFNNLPNGATLTYNGRVLRIDYTTNSVTLKLNNTAPTVAGNNSSVTVNEGTTATNTGTFSDAQGNNTVTLAANVGTVTPNYANGTWSWSYPATDGPQSLVAGSFGQTAVDWTAFTPSTSVAAGNGTATGTLTFGAQTVNVSYAGDVRQGGGFTTRTNNNAYSVFSGGNHNPSLPQHDMICNDGGTGKVHTVTFGAPVLNPRLHIFSMGAPGVSVDWTFSAPVTVISGGLSTPNSNTIRGAEQNGTVQLSGVFTQFSWTTTGVEETTGFTVLASYQSEGVVITATDDQGATNKTSFNLFVNNVAPSVTADSATVTVNEGQTPFNSGGFTDPGQDTVSITGSVGTVTQSGNVPAVVLASESFATDRPNANDGTYPAFTLNGGTAGVTGGRLRLDGGGGLFLQNFTRPGFSGSQVVSGTVQANTGGGWTAGMVLGNRRFVFHPGLNGGAFRIENAATGVGGVIVGNTNMGFNPSGTANHPMSLAYDSATNKVTVTIKDGDGVGGPFVYAWTADAGFNPSGAVGFTSQNGGPAFFDNLRVATPEPTWSWSFPTTDGPPQSQTVTITANDGDPSNNIGTATFNLVVNNVDPTATFANGGAVNEGWAGSVSFSAQSDPSSVDTAAGFRYAYDFDNDGTFDLGSGTYAGSVTAASATVPASYLADGPATRTVKGRILDKDGGSNDYTTTITVNNVAPTVTANDATVTVDEGQTATNSGTFSDPGDDAVTVTASVGTVTQGGGGATILPAGFDLTTNDGWRTTTLAKPLDPTGDNVYGTHGYAVYGGSSSQPVMQPAYANVSLSPGAAVFFSPGVAPDPGTGPQTSQVPSYTALDDPAFTGPAPVPNSRTGTVYRGGSPGQEHDLLVVTITQDGSFRLGVIQDHHDFESISPSSLRVRQTAGGSADSGQVNAYQDRDRDGDYYFFDVLGARAGDVFVLSGIEVGPHGSNGVYGVTFDNLPTPAANSGTWNWSLGTTDGPTQSQTVTITAKDSDGESTSTTFQLVVNNVKPTFEAGADETIQPPVAGLFTRNDIQITDPGNPEAFSGTVNYGDGSGDQGLTIDQSTRQFDLSHVYATQGTHTVTVTVHDGDGGSHTDSFKVSVQLNTPPVVNDQSFSVNENSNNDTVVGTVMATDLVPAGDTLTYSIVAGNTGGGFAIHPNTGVLTVANKAALDFETNPAFGLKVQVEDDFGAKDDATVTVNLNDLSGILTINDVAQAEGAGGATAYSFTVTLGAAVNDDFTVNYATANGTAGDGAGGSDNDYAAASGTLSFNGTAGEARQFTVLVNGDNKVESNEQFLANLSGLAGTNDVTIADGQGAGFVNNDDTATVSIAANDATAGEPADHGQFTVTMSNSSDTDTTVAYQVSGSAAAGSDYAALSGTVTIPAGQTSATIDVNVLDGNVVELSETVTVTLGAPAGPAATGLPYAYFINSPGQGGFYNDNSAVYGEHAVHTAGLGVYDRGDLSDGVIQPNGTQGQTQSPVVTVHMGAAPADIIFDLGGVASVSQVKIGTHIVAAFNNNAPDDVTVSFSTTGTAAGDFGGAVYKNLEAAYGPLADGHHDLLVAVPATAARYVKLSFNGGSMKEPGGEDPNEKYMLDEVTFTASGSGVNGSSAISINPNSDDATVTIADNDTATLNVGDAQVVEGDGGTAQLVFTVSADNPVDAGYTVSYSTANGRAGDGIGGSDNDYSAASGTLSFTGAAGETRSITVLVNGDDLAEATENLFVHLQNVQAGGRSVVIADGSGEGTVINDDAAPVAHAGGPYTIDEGDGLSLDGTDTTDSDSAALSYQWDVDGDGDFDENVTGASPTLSATQMAALGLGDGPDARTVTVRVSDGTNSDTADTTLTIDNVRPTANADGAATAQATPVTVNVVANDTDPAGANDPLTVTFVGQGFNGSVVDNGDGTVTYSPNSTFSGTDSFAYTIGDGDGGTSTATVTVNVAPAAAGSVVTIPDTCCNCGKTALLVTGTSGNDLITVDQGPTAAQVTVTVNGVSSVHARPTGRLIVTGQAGDDHLQVGGGITNTAWLYGDAGADKLHGGGGDGLLVGGDGADQLHGGQGRDAMIGGNGADHLVGNAGDDILVAGYTVKDGRSSAGHEKFWCDVMMEWTSSNGFGARVNNLRNGTGGNARNGTSFLLAEVRDDGDRDEVDFLQGSAGNDWMIFANGEDKVAGQVEASNNVA